MTNSRQKGARSERELANLLKGYGFEARRGVQYSGLGGEDVVGLPFIHIEAKNVHTNVRTFFYFIYPRLKSITNITA